MDVIDRENPFADPGQDSWRSACHDPLTTDIPDGDHIVEDLARPEPDQGASNSPSHAA